jgi:hypothetical protein
MRMSSAYGIHDEGSREMIPLRGGWYKGCAAFVFLFRVLVLPVEMGLRKCEMWC